MKQFQGRVICPGTCEAEALVSHGGFNTLASYQMALMFHDKQVKCGDQNNPDLYKKPMIGKALCLPETIGSTTGGMVLYTACASGQQPACMLFSKHIDSLAASGAILASVWTDADMPVIDCLGDEFLAAVQTGQTVRVLDGGADVTQMLSIGHADDLIRIQNKFALSVDALMAQVCSGLGIQGFEGAQEGWAPPETGAVSGKTRRRKGKVAEQEVPCPF